MEKSKEEKIRGIIHKIKRIRGRYNLPMVDLEVQSGISAGLLSRMLTRGYIPVSEKAQDKFIVWFEKHSSEYPLTVERTKGDTKVIDK